MTSEPRSLPELEKIWRGEARNDLERLNVIAIFTSVEALLRRTIKDYDDLALRYHRSHNTGDALRCKAAADALRDLLGTTAKKEEVEAKK